MPTVHKVWRKYLKNSNRPVPAVPITGFRLPTNRHSSFGSINKFKEFFFAAISSRKELQICEHLIVIVQYTPNPDHSARKYLAR